MADSTSATDDTVTFVMNDAFFKYLPDLGGSNEVVLIFTFSEGPKHGEDNELVKIIGPMKNQADGAFSSAVHHVSYGPKPVDGTSLRVKIQVIEFDADENYGATKMLDFIGDLASSLTLADPVTSGEIKLAKGGGQGPDRRQRKRPRVRIHHRLPRV